MRRDADIMPRRGSLTVMPVSLFVHNRKLLPAWPDRPIESELMRAKSGSARNLGDKNEWPFANNARERMKRLDGETIVLNSSNRYGRWKYILICRHHL